MTQIREIRRHDLPRERRRLASTGKLVTLIKRSVVEGEEMWLVDAGKEGMLAVKEEELLPANQPNHGPGGRGEKTQAGSRGPVRGRVRRKKPIRGWFIFLCVLGAFAFPVPVLSTLGIMLVIELWKLTLPPVEPGT